MDRMINEEISFLEESCERLLLEIENLSTSIANTRVRDSAIKTMASASGGYPYVYYRSNILHLTIIYLCIK